MGTVGGSKVIVARQAPSLEAPGPTEVGRDSFVPDGFRGVDES